MFGGKTETRILKRPSPFSEPETETKRISQTLVQADMNQNIPPIVFTESDFDDDTEECHAGPGHVIEQYDDVDVNNVEECQDSPKLDADQLDNVNNNQPNDEEGAGSVDVLENLVAKLAPLAELKDL